jgi:aspartate/methionine/tyrosine aminotransferase
MNNLTAQRAHTDASSACDLKDKAVCRGRLEVMAWRLRIGWLATRSRSSSRRLLLYTTEMPNTPCQILAGRILERGDKVLQRNRSQIAANVGLLGLFASRHHDKLALYPPQGGTMAIVEQKTSLTSTEFCEQLLNEEKVFLVPGGVLGISDRLLRFGLGRRDFAQGLERLECFLHRRVAR